MFHRFAELGAEPCLVRTTEFDIPPDKARQLFQSGQQAAEQFLATWDFEAYKQKFRSGQTVTRRGTVKP